MEIYTLNCNKNNKRELTERYRKINFVSDFVEDASPINVIKQFLETTSEYCVISDSNVYLHLEFKQMMLYALEYLMEHNLDLVLLGYLIHKSPEHFGELLDNPSVPTVKFYNYDSKKLWGTSSYLITRSYATRLLEEYLLDYSLEDRFDYTVTKSTEKRCFIYPPLAVGYPDTESEDQGEIWFQRTSSGFLFDPLLYI